jgi:hypothetical protein
MNKEKPKVTIESYKSKNKTKKKLRKRLTARFFFDIGVDNSFEMKFGHYVDGQKL